MAQFVCCVHCGAKYPSDPLVQIVCYGCNRLLWPALGALHIRPADATEIPDVPPPPLPDVPSFHAETPELPEVPTLAPDLSEDELSWFNSAWDVLEEQCSCDARGGMQYERCLREWHHRGRLLAMLTFILKEANDMTTAQAEERAEGLTDNGDGIE